MARVLSKLPLVGCLAWLGTACNGLFYYPTSEILAHPRDQGREFDAFSVAAGDGTKLSGWALHHTGAARGVVLHFHGNAENMSTHMDFSDWLTEHGYDVLVFDYRGYGTSEGKPSRQGLLLDGIAMARYADDYARSRNLGLFVLAQSLGGAVSIPALAEVKPERLRGVVVEGSFASYRGIARDSLSRTWWGLALQWPLGFLVSDDASPVDRVGELTVPLLFLHAKDDDVVPYPLGRLLAAAADPALCRFETLEDGGHLGALVGAESPWRKVVLDFFACAANGKCASGQCRG